MIYQDFIRGSHGHQRRTVLTAGACVVVIVLLIAAVTYAANRLTSDGGQIKLDVRTSQVAPGVKAGTVVILRGAHVGSITAVRRLGSGDIQVEIALDSDGVSGLTDAMGMDFRPENYFGVTALNLVPNTGGNVLRSGMRLARRIIGDFTMSTMIERGSIVTSETLSKEMTATLDKILTYTNGLTPLIESGLIFANEVAQTQKALPSVQIGYANDILAVVPDFLGQAIEGGYQVFQGAYNRRLPNGTFSADTETLNNSDKGLSNISGSLFSAVGHLLKSHATDLAPAVEIVKLYTDRVPDLVGDRVLGPRLRTVVDRLNIAFGGSAGGPPSLRLRVVMDALPGMAAPAGLGGLDLRGAKR